MCIYMQELFVQLRSLDQPQLHRSRHDFHRQEFQNPGDESVCTFRCVHHPITHEIYVYMYIYTYIGKG